MIYMKKNLLKKLAKKTGIGGFVIFLLLFALGAFQIRPAPGPELYIETDRGCGGQFTLSEETLLSFWMTGAAPDSEYLYWVKIYTESGETLCGWRGMVATDSAGSTSKIDIEHIISLPVGLQYAEVSIPELGLESTCSLLVEGNTEIPSAGYKCHCEELTLSSTLEQDAVTPGDPLTLTVRVENRMDCEIILDKESLVVDLGSLGGKVYPLKENRKIDSYAASNIEIVLVSVPYLATGAYPINIEYTYRDISKGTLFSCTWAAYTQVDINSSGTLSVVSSPPVTKNREGSIVLEVANPTTESTTYTVVVTPPDGITLLNDPIITLPVAGQSTQQITIPFIGEKEGEYILNFTLLVGDTVIDEISATVQVTGFKGSLELVSPPSSAKPNETVNLKFRVTNTSPEDTTYTLSVDVSEEFTALLSSILNGSYTLSADVSGELTVANSLSVSVPAGGTVDLSLPVTPAEEGSFLLTFDLFCEGDLIDSVEWRVTVEQGINIVVMAAVVAAVVVTGAGAAFAAKSFLSKHGLTEKGAAEAWEKINRIEQAAEIYKKGADIQEQLKNIKGALKDREEAALLYEKAAAMAEESGSYEKAASLWEKAACEWQKTKKVDRAGQDFEKTAYLFNRTGNTVHAREAQEMAAQAYEQAATLGMEIKEFRAAGTFYEKAGALYREADKPHEASQVYNKAEDLWNQVQDLDKKQKTEETLGATYEEEAKKAEERGDYERAALSYEKAADTWRKMGNQSRAAKDEQKALELYDKMNR
ncbi:MAG: hypothetical protein WBA22_03050 [Candidatus Methanofastidiosia archaeon]